MLAVLSVERGPGAEACLDQAHLKRSVERRLKRRVFVVDGEASLRLHVGFTVHGGETEARIELASIDGTPRGTRSLVTTGHCSALDDSLALSVALLVDEPPDPVEPKPADGAGRPAQPISPTAKAPAAPTGEAPPSPKRVITIPSEVAAPREPWHVRFGAAAKVAWGTLPGVRPAAAFSLGIVPRDFAPILLQGEAFWPTRAARNATSGARFHLLRAALALCPPLWSRPNAMLGLCFGQQLGWLTVEGYGFDHDSKEQRLSYALTAGGEARLRLFPPVSLRGYAGAEVPLVRDRFTSGGRNAAELFQPSPVAMAGEIGLEALLW